MSLALFFLAINDLNFVPVSQRLVLIFVIFAPVDKKGQSMVFINTVLKNAAFIESLTPYREKIP